MKVYSSKSAITKMQAVIIIVIILVVAIVSAAYYVTLLPGPTPPEEVTFTFATRFEVDMCDPCLVVTTCAMTISQCVYDSLLEPSYEDYEPEPWLVTSHTVSADGKTYTMTLREGVKFHDGTELTAEDVAFTMDRMLTLKKGLSWLWSEVLSPGDTEVIDNYTVAFHLHSAYGPFISTLVQFPVMNKRETLAHIESGLYGEFGDYGVKWLQDGHDAGSGPYKIEQWVLGEIYVFRKFEDHWKMSPWKPNSIDKVTVKIIKEEAAQKLAIMKGDIDMVDTYCSYETCMYLKEQEGIIVDESPGLGIWVITTNTQLPPLDDVHVRRAIAYAYDYDAVVNQIIPGSTQCRGPVPSILKGHSPEAVMYKRDLNKAQEELAKSKYSMEELQAMELTLVLAEAELREKLTLLFQSNLKDIGLNVQIQREPWVRLVEICSKAETTPHFITVLRSARYASADNGLYPVFYSKNPPSYYTANRYKNATLDEVLLETRTTTDENRRMELYKEAQNMVTQQAVQINIVQEVSRVAFRDHVKGYSPNPVMQHNLCWHNFIIEK